MPTDGDAQAAADPLVGRTIAGGRYTITSVLGRGGMQSVGFKKKEGAAAVAKELADDDAFVLKNTAPFDWRRALIENRPGMRELIQLYARKGR